MTPGLHAGAAVAMAVLAIGCAHRVELHSDPAGARAYVDDVFVGLTPTAFVERAGPRRSASIRLEKEGFRTITAEERPRWRAACVWSFGRTLADRYDYVLRPVEPDAGDEPGR